MSLVIDLIGQLNCHVILLALILVKGPISTKKE